MTKNGFTLAEVLITLGVVGVISAMTLPTLIQNYRNHVVETRLKKFYSTFNQAIQKSVADNGEYIYWEYFDNIYSNLDSETITNRVDKYIKPYLKITKEKEIANYHLYYLADGSAFMYRSTSMRDISYFPINPDKHIGKYGITGSSCFAFVFAPILNAKDWKYHYKKGLEPMYYKWNGDISSLYTDTTYGCNGGNGFYCTGIIMQNGWKIPKDYPKKIKF